MKLFNSLGSEITAFTGDIEVTNDLDFSDQALEFPLGYRSTSRVSFKGSTFNGNNHKITNLVMNTTTKTYKNAGLFYHLYNATIENLIIDSSCSFAGDISAALAPSFTDDVTVKNVIIKATVTAQRYAAGFIGSVQNTHDLPLSFENCVNEGHITSIDQYAGGFIGRMYDCPNRQVVISNSFNNGNVTGKNSVGGFIGGIDKGSDGKTINSAMIFFVGSSNNGNVTSEGSLVGGFIGMISNTEKVLISALNSTNSGSVHGNHYIGGFVGSVQRSTNIEVIISNCENHGSITGSYSVGGFVGYIYNSANSALNITNGINNGFTKGTGEQVGGFIGTLNLNDNLNVGITNSEIIASVSGRTHVGGFIGITMNSKNSKIVLSHCICGDLINGSGNVGGFVGYITSNSGFSLALEITNSVNEGTILTSNKNACGMFCVDTKYNFNVSTTVHNSINRGEVRTGSIGTAYGITNNITKATNVVSMGWVTGSSNSHSFWETSFDASMFFGLKSKCQKCADDGATVFEKSAENGLFITESGERVDETLNKNTNEDDAKWTFELSLTTNFVNVIAGKPVNGEIIVDGANPLGQLLDLCNVFMGGCTIVNKQTNKPIYGSSIKNGTMVSFCHSVSVDGFIQKTLFVEMNTEMKDIDALSTFWSDHYDVIDADEASVVYNSSFVVNKNMRLLIVEKHCVAFGKPISKSVFVRTGMTLGQICQQEGIGLDGFVVRNQETQEWIEKAYEVVKDLHLELLHQVIVSGVLTATLFVEHESCLGDINELKPFLNEEFWLFNPSDTTHVYTTNTIIESNIEVRISRQACVSFGHPLNTKMFVTPGTTLETIQQQHGFQLDGFIVLINGTQTILTGSSKIETDTELILCHTVTVSGFFTASLLVEHGTHLGDVPILIRFFNQNFSVTSEKETLNGTSVVDKNMAIIIKVVKTIQIVISFDDSENITDDSVKDAIGDIAGSIGSNPSLVEVVPDADGSFIISIIATEDDANTLVDTLKNCSSTIS